MQINNINNTMTQETSKNTAEGKKQIPEQSDNLSDYEKYCRMMAQQQEEEMEELCVAYQPEGQFVRGH